MSRSQDQWSDRPTRGREGSASAARNGGARMAPPHGHPAGTSTTLPLQHLQRTAGNRAVSHLVRRSVVLQRLPYAQNYSAALTRKVLNQSEGRASPHNGTEGHPRQHVGRWGKAERVADEQQKTKSVYVDTAAQDRAIASALSSAAGQGRLGLLDVSPGQPQRTQLIRLATEAVDVKVVKAKTKARRTGQPAFVGPLPQGMIAPGTVKTWELVAGTATRATVIVDSLGTGRPGDIHIQTAYPVLD